MITIEEKKKEKNNKIQMIRAIAIITVILAHTCPGGKYQVYVIAFINFAVQTFFFLSGYLTKLEVPELKKFYKKRIIRVLIPYVIWTFLYTTFNFIDYGVDLKKYITNLLTTQSSGALFFIFVYIQLVLITPLLGKLAKSKYKWLGLLITPAYMLIKYYWIIKGIEPNKYMSIIWSICCLGWVSYYYLGMLLGNGIVKKELSIKKLGIIYVITIAIQILEGYIWYRFGREDCGTQVKLSNYITSVAVIMIFYWYLKNDKLNKTSKTLVMIGNYSFGIYISQLMIIKTLLKIPGYKEIPFICNSIIILFITVLFVVVCNKIFGKKISRWMGLC